MNNTVLISTHDFRLAIQWEMAVKLLRDLIENHDYVRVEEVKRILDAIDED